MCTDCILARITVINVQSGDYGTFRLRATSEDIPGYMAEGKVRLYRKFLIFISIVFNWVFILKIFNLRNSGMPTIYYKSRQ